MTVTGVFHGGPYDTHRQEVAPVACGCAESHLPAVMSLKMPRTDPAAWAIYILHPMTSPLDGVVHYFFNQIGRSMAGVN